MAAIALQSAASGLSALSTKLDVVANNLANVNTEGFKASRANFQDLLYVEREQPGVETATGDQRPTGLYVGLGVKVSGTQVTFEQGAPIQTGNDLDIFIEGEGFFQVMVEDALAPGSIAYTRAGNFALNADGELVLANSEGRRLEPGIEIPTDAIRPIQISADGRVLVRQPGAQGLNEVGRIQLANFVNPAGLKQLGANLFAETVASGPPLEGNPLEDNRGGIRNNMLESSNVDPTRELIELIRTQRAFEMNSQSIRAADEALSTISQLRR
ncbi:MAG: flagellar basal-body rod protein FlgG [Phycisphaera sp.]|nr:MAG: flagellar basal-body rod protein FlgG [Phycisphaera sp.]